MRGLLFAILFCAVSLLFAEVLATLLIQLALIRPSEFDIAHNLIMTVMLVVYMLVAPTFRKDFKHHNDKDDKQR